jgi:hypothetical protein
LDGQTSGPRHCLRLTREKGRQMTGDTGILGVWQSHLRQAGPSRHFWQFSHRHFREKPVDQYVGQSIPGQFSFDGSSNQ